MSDSHTTITTKAVIETASNEGHGEGNSDNQSQEDAICESATPVSPLKSVVVVEEGKNSERSTTIEDIQRRTSLQSSTSAINILSSVGDIMTLPSATNLNATNENEGSFQQTFNPQDGTEGERSCWICFATDEDNRLAAWVQPCKCRGTTKWVHQSCLYRWVDEKQKGNALRTVNCQQCQTEYIIVFPQMGKVANILEAFDNIIRRVSPFLAAGIFVGSLYWTAVTYGAVTFLQIVGHKKGLALMENGDPILLLIGLPVIPVGLVLGRMIRWEDAVIRLIRNRRNVARKLPLMNFIIPYPEEDEEQTAQNPATPTLSDPVSATRIFCGALLLPTISSIVGRLLFESIENTLHRTLLGGLTFITVKGILKIYLKQQQHTRKKKRRIVDYTEENVRVYVNRSNSNRSQGNPAGATAASGAQQQQANVPRTNERDSVV
ncbi:E3 ubiquitin-protein ligase MARCHF5 [Stomoxys calcitrans]|uniref:E3 ubiquitin-protein ligase MARCHF5 n=1 Tax=Stomoxys calcitrans TaxID=35570 RepID=A0A1I8Q051_STOCA|nr:E3 ubiquitin-protein ligase MARCHF5 [Stomoxys calcitrans]